MKAHGRHDVKSRQGSHARRLDNSLVRTLISTYIVAALLSFGAAIWFARAGLGSFLGWCGALGAAVAVAHGVRSMRRTLTSVRSLTHMVARLEKGLETGSEAGSREGSWQESVRQALLLSVDEETARLAAALDRLGSKQRRRVEQLALERATLEAVLQSLADPVIAVDASLRIIFSNRPAQELFFVNGGTGEETLTSKGRHAIEVIRDHDCVALLQQAIDDGKMTSGTFRLGVSSTSARIYHVAVSPIRGAGQSVGGAVCVLHDQTELRRLERIRSDFVANVSHELRTPLTAVHGFIETLQDGSYRDPKRTLRYLEIMHAETTRLIAIINDLLHLSRLEGPADVLAKERVDLGGVAHEVGELVRKRAEEKGIRLTVEAAQPVAFVSGDSASIRQALLNLVDNAVKYTEAGGAVTVRVTPDGSGVRVTVVDTGVGIPEQALDRVFERFYRVDKARSRKEGGTGLGLSLVKHTIERHQGRLGIESTVGKGTTIWFWLPAADAPGNARMDRQETQYSK